MMMMWRVCSTPILHYFHIVINNHNVTITTIKYVAHAFRLFYVDLNLREYFFEALAPTFLGCFRRFVEVAYLNVVVFVVNNVRNLCCLKIRSVIMNFLI